MVHLARYLLISIPLSLMVVPSSAHDTWISRGGLKNTAGEWCCGAYDCKSYQQISSIPQGWVIGAELVPFDEAMPVPPPDGQLTICSRPDGSRRCVFGLKPSN
jgi:hypothetical protein